MGSLAKLVVEYPIASYSCLEWERSVMKHAVHSFWEKVGSHLAVASPAVVGFMKGKFVFLLFIYYFCFYDFCFLFYLRFYTEQYNSHRWDILQASDSILRRIEKPEDTIGWANDIVCWLDFWNLGSMVEYEDDPVDGLVCLLVFFLG